MATQEVLHVGAQIKAQEYLARPGQYGNEAHQRPLRAADVQVAEMTPLCRVSDYAEYFHQNGLITFQAGQATHLDEQKTRHSFLSQSAMRKASNASSGL